MVRSLVGRVERLSIPTSKWADSLPIGTAVKPFSFDLVPSALNLVEDILKILAIIVCGHRVFLIYLIYLSIDRSIYLFIYFWSFALMGFLEGMWERLCGVLLAKYHLNILTGKSGIYFSFLHIDFLLACNLGQDLLLILFSLALNLDF